MQSEKTPNNRKLGVTKSNNHENWRWEVRIDQINKKTIGYEVEKTSNKEELKDPKWENTE